MTAWMTPDLAYLLLVSGTVVLAVALLTPGTGLLEVAAALLLLLAGYGGTLLEVNAWAVGVWLLGVFFFVLSVRRTRHTGIWLALALASMIVGSVFIFRAPDGGSAVSPWLAIVVSLVVGSTGWVVTRKVLDAEFQPPAHDPDRLLGRLAEARTPIDREGTVFIDGEFWTARSTTPIPAGSMVRITGREGLILIVEKAPEEDTLPD